MRIQRITGLIAITASLASFSTPTFAAVDMQYGGQYPELDLLCDDLLQANDNSGFVTYATDGSSSSSTVVEDIGPTTSTGIGPASTVISNYNNAHVNGQSVNIHAFGDRVTTYAGGHTETTPTKTTVTTTLTASCHVHKPTSGAGNDPLHEGFSVAPPGLQVGPVSSSSEVVTYGTRTETFPGPSRTIRIRSEGGRVVAVFRAVTFLGSLGRPGGCVHNLHLGDPRPAPSAA